MPDALNIPNDLLELERAAMAAHDAFLQSSPDGRERRMRAWRDAAEAVQAAVTAHAASKGLGRYDVEQAVKRTVRHTAPDAEK